MKKIGIPLYTPVFLYKSGFQGVYISRTCFHVVLSSIHIGLGHLSVRKFAQDTGNLPLRPKNSVMIIIYHRVKASNQTNQNE